MTMHTRIITFIAATIAAITLSSTHATAQPFIQIDISGTAHTGSSNEYLPFGVRAIFDTVPPGLNQTDGSVSYNAVRGEAIEMAGLGISSSAPFVVSSAPLEYTPADVVLTYIAGQYWISADVNGENMELHNNYIYGHFANWLSGYPEDYEMDLGGRLSFTSPYGDAVWDEHSALGTILVTVTVVDGPPQPEPECLVDLNNDGALDFFDISTFLTLFGAGCP